MVAENQVEVTKAVSEYGAAINLGSHFEVSSQDISNKIDELIGNPEKVKELSMYSFELVSSEIVKTFPVLNTIRGVLR
jgi:UDP-2,4-diacetamido-2,4,6-trideoxy-beta-L-altropyranose hydrolase